MGRLRCLYALCARRSARVQSFLDTMRPLPVFRNCLACFQRFFPASVAVAIIEGNFYPATTLPYENHKFHRKSGRYELRPCSKWNLKRTRTRESSFVKHWQCGSRRAKQLGFQRDEQKVRVKGYSEKDRLIAIHRLHDIKRIGFTRQTTVEFLNGQ